MRGIGNDPLGYHEVLLPHPTIFKERARVKVSIKESIARRQAILNWCKGKAMLISELAELANMTVPSINHQLIILVNEGYLSKNKANTSGVSVCAYNYKTIKKEPYVCVETEKAIEVVRCPVDYPPALMRMMGYLKV